MSSHASDEECFLCRIQAESNDAENLIVLRAKHNFVVLNRYPYTSGHLMVAPYAHTATLEASDPVALEEMMALARSMESALREVYRPDGFNIGLNIGRSAGAGVVGHLHLHMLPRWSGDVNFMTAIGDTRVIPENLDTTYQKLSKVVNRADG